MSWIKSSRNGSVSLKKDKLRVKQGMLLVNEDRFHVKLVGAIKVLSKDHLRQVTGAIGK